MAASDGEFSAWDVFTLTTSLPAGSVIGASDADVMFGGDGADTLYGGQGVDTLLGSGGDDWLVGGVGDDTLTGGSGADVFLFADANLEDLGIDRITDFTPGEDRITLKRSLFSALAEGQLSADNFAANATGAAETDQHHLIYNNTTGALLYDADGSGQAAAIHFATLDKKPELKATDIFAAA